MVMLVRIARVLLILTLVLLALSFLMALGQPNSGWVERIVLIALIAGCVAMAAEVSRVAARVQSRMVRR